MNVIRLRRDIDAGKAADKSPGMDPETAPLRTHDQPAGAPIDPQWADDDVRVRPDGEALSRQHSTPDYEDTTPSGTRISSVETVVRWCAMGVALTLAAFLGVWLLK